MGEHDFDFLFGRWHIDNHRLADATVDTSEWLTFAASSEERPILGGLGNIEEYAAPDFPARGAFRAMALRLFEPDTGLWRIWWMSTAQPGMLQTPVVGRFVDGRGLFESDELIANRSVKVRFTWTYTNASSARWEQAFSFDAGSSWQPNWIMEFSRDQ